MDLPVHVLAGSVVGNAIIYKATQYSSNVLERNKQIKVAIACFLWGVLSHLFLDSLPHYDWLFKIDIFRPLPFYWLYPQIFTIVPVAAITFYLTQDYWMIAGAAMLGGMYPDIEKLLYFDCKLPRSSILFPRHSCYLSGTPWEYKHKYVLVFAEICLFAVVMACLFRIAQRREERLYTKFPALSYHVQ